MKQFIAALIVLTIFAIALYGFGAFVAFDLNPGDWPALVRFLTAGGMSYITLKVIAELDE